MPIGVLRVQHDCANTSKASLTATFDSNFGDDKANPRRVQHDLSVGAVEHHHLEGAVPFFCLGLQVPLYCGGGNYRIMRRQNDLSMLRL